MTQQQKTIKLAEFEGWKFLKEDGFFWLERPDGKKCHGSSQRPTLKTWQDNLFFLPKYFEDLNAVRKLEEKLTDDQWTDYLNNLYYITFKPAAKDRDKQAIHASAEDKCEALGKILNLWS
jgi:hypothetical protein